MNSTVFPLARTRLPLSALLLIPVMLASAMPDVHAEELIARGSDWHYLDDGSDQGTGWRETDFDDSGWDSGPAQLGFGDGDEATVLSSGHITYYFRHTLTIDDPADIAGLALSILRDDGAVVYVNGTEVFRTNMPAGTILYSTRASTAVETGEYFEHEFESSSLDIGVERRRRGGPPKQHVEFGREFRHGPQHDGRGTRCQRPRLVGVDLAVSR